MNADATNWDSQGMRNGLALAGILAIGLAARLYGITGESAWGDEAVTTWCHPADSMSACVDCLFAADNRLRIAPIYYLVQCLWAALSGGSLLALRMLSLTCSLGVIVMVYFIGRQLFSSSAARWAALFTALSLLQIYQGQEVRFYALVSLMTALSFYFFVQLHRAGPGLWALYFLTNAALLFTHSFAVFIFPAQGIALLLTQGRNIRLWMGWGIAHVGIAAIMIGWIAILNYNLDGQSDVYNDRPAGLRELGNGMLRFAGGRHATDDPAPYMSPSVSLDESYSVVVLMLLAFGLTTAALRYRWRPDQEVHSLAWQGTLQLWCWFLVPFLGLFVLSHLWKPCFYPRYVSYAAPAIPLLMAAALAQLPAQSAFRRALAVLLVGALVYQNFALARPFRPDYRAVAAQVMDDPPDKTVVFALKNFNYHATRYACQNYHVVEVEGMADLLRLIPEVARQGNTVWVTFNRWSDFERFESDLTASGLTFTRLTTGGIPEVIAYRIVSE